jgi:hypothetical protein
MAACPAPAVDIRGNANTARLGERFEPRRNIDPVAIDVASLGDDVADIDAGAQRDAAILRKTSVPPDHAALDRDGEADRVHRAREFGQDAVARRLDDAAVMHGDQRIDQILALRLQGAQRTDLVSPHEPGVAGNVDGDDRCQPALDARLLHRLSLSPLRPADLAQIRRFDTHGTLNIGRTRRGSRSLPSCGHPRGAAARRSRFGGGADLTPIYPDPEAAQMFHAALAAACDGYDPDCHRRFKGWCDEYFFLKHRGEPRGAGGIFFDYLDGSDWERDFAFVRAVGEAFLAVYPAIVRQRMRLAWTDEQRRHQLVRRGHYVEFNLLYDRGTTRFGRNTCGNVEAILMSLPPGLSPASHSRKRERKMQERSSYPSLRHPCLAQAGGKPIEELYPCRIVRG